MGQNVGRQCIFQRDDAEGARPTGSANYIFSLIDQFLQPVFIGILWCKVDVGRERKYAKV